MDETRKFYDRPFEVSENKTPAILFDLDGTVALMNGRDPYNSNACIEDLPNMPVIIMIKALMYSYPKCTFIAVSGREDRAWYKTLMWLDDFDIAPNFLMMRKTGDGRSDDIVKEEIYIEEIKPNYNVIFVVDDREQVVSMWRQHGLSVFQVAPGDF